MTKLACRNADTLKRLNDTERALKEQREKAYVNLDLSNEEKEKGNQVRRAPVSTVIFSTLNPVPGEAQLSINGPIFANHVHGKLSYLSVFMVVIAW